MFLLPELIQICLSFSGKELRSHRLVSKEWNQIAKTSIYYKLRVLHKALVQSWYQTTIPEFEAIMSQQSDPKLYNEQVAQFFTNTYLKKSIHGRVALELSKHISVSVSSSLIEFFISPLVLAPQYQHLFLFKPSTVAFRNLCGKPIPWKVTILHDQQQVNDDQKQQQQQQQLSITNNWFDLLIIYNSPCACCLDQWSQTMISNIYQHITINESYENYGNNKDNNTGAQQEYAKQFISYPIYPRDAQSKLNYHGWKVSVEFNVMLRQMFGEKKQRSGKKMDAKYLLEFAKQPIKQDPKQMMQSRATYGASGGAFSILVHYSDHGSVEINKKCKMYQVEYIQYHVNARVELDYNSSAEKQENENAQVKSIVNDEVIDTYTWQHILAFQLRNEAAHVLNMLQTRKALNGKALDEEVVAKFYANKEYMEQVTTLASPNSKDEVVSRIKQMKVFPVLTPGMYILDINPTSIGIGYTIKTSLGGNSEMVTDFDSW